MTPVTKPLYDHASYQVIYSHQWPSLEIWSACSFPDKQQPKVVCIKKKQYEQGISQLKELKQNSSRLKILQQSNYNLKKIISYALRTHMHVFTMHKESKWSGQCSEDPHSALQPARITLLPKYKASPGRMVLNRMAQSKQHSGKGQNNATFVHNKMFKYIQQERLCWGKDTKKWIRSWTEVSKLSLLYISI